MDVESFSERKTRHSICRKKDFDKKGEQSLETIAGSSTNQVFSGDQDTTKNGIVRVNEVTLKKLQQGTTYVYRVGDGRELVRVARVHHFNEEAKL